MPQTGALAGALAGMQSIMNMIANNSSQSRLIVGLILVSSFLWGLSCSGDSTGPDPNRAPGKPQLPQGSAVVVIDVQSSYSSSVSDADNDQISLWFFWGDGDSTQVGPAASGTVLSAAHAYSVLGSFRIRVVALDSKGLRSIDSDELRINVLQPGPQAPTRPVGPDSLFLSTRQTYSSQAISPAGGLLAVMFVWDDGDSTLSTWDTSGATFSAEHIYFDTGSFFVRARALDDSGRVSTLSLAKVVAAINSPPFRPNPPFGPLSASTDEFVNFYATAVDPDGNHAALTFHWGDGTAQKTAFASTDDIFTSSHRYVDTGMFQVRVSAEDIFGGRSDTSLGTWIHIPTFAIDTVFITGSGLDPSLVVIDPGERIQWINLDDENHVIEPDIDGVFPGKFLKPGGTHIVSMSFSGTFEYHDKLDPANVLFQGKIIVRE